MKWVPSHWKWKIPIYQHRYLSFLIILSCWYLEINRNQYKSIQLYERRFWKSDLIEFKMISCCTYFQETHSNERGIIIWMIKNLKKWWEKLVSKSCFSSATQKAQNHSNQRTILSFLMPPAGLEPALCRQKGILSPSCLPTFGKVNFHSLYRLIFHCERGFSFVSERDSHFFDKTILPHFSLHVNHVKLFHLVVLELRSVRGPEHRRGVRSAQMRSSGWVMRGGMVAWSVYWWTGLDDGLFLIFWRMFWERF